MVPMQNPSIEKFVEGKIKFFRFHGDVYHSLVFIECLTYSAAVSCKRAGMQLTQTVPAFKPLDRVVARFKLLVNTPAARPYSDSFALSCMRIASVSLSTPSLSLADYCWRPYRSTTSCGIFAV